MSAHSIASIGTSGRHGELAASRSTSIKHMFIFSGHGLFFLPIFLQSIGEIYAPTHGIFQLVGHIVLALASGTALVGSAYLVNCCLKATLLESEETDWALVGLSIVVPFVLLLTRFFPLPTSDDSKVNCLVSWTRQSMRS